MRINDSIFKEVNRNLEELHRQLVVMNTEMEAKLQIKDGRALKTLTKTSIRSHS